MAQSGGTDDGRWSGEIPYLPPFAQRPEPKAKDMIGYRVTASPSPRLRVAFDSAASAGHSPPTGKRSSRLAIPPNGPPDRLAFAAPTLRATTPRPTPDRTYGPPPAEAHRATGKQNPHRKMKRSHRSRAVRRPADAGRQARRPFLPGRQTTALGGQTITSPTCNHGWLFHCFRMLNLLIVNYLKIMKSAPPLPSD